VRDIAKPEKADLDRLVAPFLEAQPSGLGFAIGYASPTFSNFGGLYFAGNVRNQFRTKLGLNATTPFEIASITKTFTSTLYARLIRTVDPKRTVGDYCSPNGRLPINSVFAPISLDQLMNYTSGLPADNEKSEGTVPRLWPQPYSIQGMMSFLECPEPDSPLRDLSDRDQKFTYSNLAFAIMSAIIASEEKSSPLGISAFVNKMREHIFKPLDIHATFFHEVSLTNLPLGFGYNNWPDPKNDEMPSGHPFFPAYLGVGGVVATAQDMFNWLLFNMGIKRNEHLTPLLPALQEPSTPVMWMNSGWGSAGSSTRRMVNGQGQSSKTAV